MVFAGAVGRGRSASLRRSRVVAIDPKKCTGTPPAPLCCPWTTGRPISGFGFLTLAQLLKLGNGFLCERVIEGREVLRAAIADGNARSDEEGLGTFNAGDEGGRTKAVTRTGRSLSSTRARRWGQRRCTPDPQRLHRPDRQGAAAHRELRAGNGLVLRTPHQMCVRWSISAQYSLSVNIVVTQIGRTGP
jgi:hypothetical protein